MGFYTRNIPTTEIEVTGYNKRRTSVAIMNLGTGRVFVSQDPANIADNGWPLDPGWAMGLTVLEGDEPDLALYAVSDVGTNGIRVVEQFGKDLIERVSSVFEGQ